MLSAEFEPATTVTKRPQIYALDLAATGIGYSDRTHGWKKIPLKENTVSAFVGVSDFNHSDSKMFVDVALLIPISCFFV
jgi:hypothetical protein